MSDNLYKQRTSPFWWYDFSYRGRRYRASTGVRDKPLARKVMELKIAEIRLGRPLDGPVVKETPRFAAYAQAYLDGAGALKRSRASDRSILKRALTPFFGTKRLAEITCENVERFRNERLTGKLSEKGRNTKAEPAKRTVEAELALLHRILNLAVEAGHLGRNPAARVRVPKFDNRRDRVIDPEEYERLLTAVNDAKGAHLVPMMVLAYETGMREGEILALRWEDVDFRRHLARLRRTKNGEARSVPLTEEAERVLRPPVWWRRDADYVFPSKDGRGYLGRVSHVFARVAKRAKVQGARFHDFRHTFCTRMVERGVDLITLQAITGHKTLDMLQRYSHPSEARKLALVRGTSYHRHSGLDSPDAIPQAIDSTGRL